MSVWQVASRLIWTLSKNNSFDPLGIDGAVAILLMISGTVQMDCEVALSPAEKSTGYILACQARPLASVVVDA